MVATNTDGLRNSCANPAKFGSMVSLYVHGAGGLSLGLPMPSSLGGIQAQVGQCSAAVESVSLAGLVYKVDVRLPGSLLPCATSYSNINPVNPFSLTLSYNGTPVGPTALTNGTPATQSQPMTVWATQ